MVFNPTLMVMNLTPVGYIASASSGTGRSTGKIRPRVGTADLASVAPATPAAEIFRNSRRELVIFIPSPGNHRIFKERAEFFRSGRPRREFGYAMLRQRPLHQLRNIGGRITNVAQSVGRLQALHKPGDSLGQNAASVFGLAARNIHAQRLGRLHVPLRVRRTSKTEDRRCV